VFFAVKEINPEGCKIVAGGRSVAQTTGKSREFYRTLEECKSLWHPFRVRRLFRLFSGGLRSAPTTGYFLAALQANAELTRPALLDRFAQVVETRAGAMNCGDPIHV